MNTSILFAVVSALSSVACDISCLEDCDWSDECSEEHGYGGNHNAGGPSGDGNASGGPSGTGNESGGVGNSGHTGGTTNIAGKGGDSKPVPTPCAQESDCARGFNCDYERMECVQAGAETCAELSTEADCDNRNDCMSIYAGKDCSCGPDCACIGGEAGCVCQSFAFFSCEPVKG
jgi:hypothetical protein